MDDAVRCVRGPEIRLGAGRRPTESRAKRRDRQTLDVLLDAPIAKCAQRAACQLLAAIRRRHERLAGLVPTCRGSAAAVTRRQHVLGAADDRRACASAADSYRRFIPPILRFVASPIARQLPQPQALLTGWHRGHQISKELRRRPRILPRANRSAGNAMSVLIPPPVGHPCLLVFYDTAFRIYRMPRVRIPMLRPIAFRPMAYLGFASRIVRPMRVGPGCGPFLVRICKVSKGSPAELAGLRVGDSVLRVNRVAVGRLSVDKIEHLYRCLKPGETVELLVRRADGTLAALTLDAAPQDGGSPSSSRRCRYPKHPSVPEGCD